MRAYVVVACLLLTVLAAPGAVAAPPYEDCDYGVLLGGSFTGFCGEAPDCVAVFLLDRWVATVGCD